MFTARDQLQKLAFFDEPSANNYAKRLDLEDLVTIRFE
jgi:hypothetical protein